MAVPDAAAHNALASVPTPPPSPVSDLLTLIVTTSPTPSAPETELLSQVLSSFRVHCPALLACRVIVVLDTYDHIKPRARLKRGQVTPEGAQVYELYKQRVKSLFLREYASHSYADADDHSCLEQSQADAEFGFDGRKNPLGSAVSLSVSRTADGAVTFVEPADRLGFGLAVRTALRLTETPYVWIHQHDWTLVADVPVAGMLDVMMASTRPPSSPPSPSITPALSLSSLSLSSPPESDCSLSPEAADADPMPTDIDSPPVKYICLPSCRLRSYAVQAHVTSHPALLRLTRELKRTFEPTVDSLPPVPLTPLFFWHDKPHIAETSHYLARIFPTRLSIPRGAFIEDTVGHRARDQMKMGNWARWACWMYYPDNGKQLCLRHLHGRTWRGSATELEKKEKSIALNIKGKKSKKGARKTDGSEAASGGEDLETSVEQAIS